MSNPTLEYFEEYRRKKDELKEIESMAVELRRKMDDLRSQSSDIRKELDGMRKIIAVMIETGMEPVEVKMKHEISELSDTLWESSILISDDLVTTATISPTTVTWTTTGANTPYVNMGQQSSISTGATGAVGASLYPNTKPMRITGANGVI